MNDMDAMAGLTSNLPMLQEGKMLGQMLNGLWKEVYRQMSDNLVDPANESTVEHLL